MAIRRNTLLLQRIKKKKKRSCSIVKLFPHERQYGSAPRPIIEVKANGPLAIVHSLAGSGPRLSPLVLTLPLSLEIPRVLGRQNAPLA